MLSHLGRSVQQTPLHKEPYLPRARRSRAPVVCATASVAQGAVSAVPIPNYEIVVAGVVFSAVIHHIFMPFHVRTLVREMQPCVVLKIDHCAILLQSWNIRHLTVMAYAAGRYGSQKVRH
jgi:hypothetical protein